MKKIPVLAIPLSLLVFCFTIPVAAKEITPTAGSYSYGSTSEFSPSAQVTTVTTSSTSTDLAPTGQSKNIPVIIGGIVVLLGIVILVLSQRKLRKK